MKVFKKKTSDVEKRLQAVERETGLRQEKKREEKSATGGYLIQLNLSSFFLQAKTLSEQVADHKDEIRELQKELNELREYLGVKYDNALKYPVLIEKPEPEESPKTWKDKLVDAVEEAIDENCDY